MIVLSNVNKYYDVSGRRKYVLKDASVVIPSHKSVGVLGLNGAGKSTLVRMIGGVDYPNSGTISFDKSISWPLGLSNGFQASLTGADNVKFVCRINSTGKDAMLRKIEFVKDFSELGDYFDMPVKTYSSGMKSRLAFGLSMAFDFEVYLIDEILSVGDKDFRKKCTDIMNQKREKSNIIMVSHDLGNMKEMCDSGILLRDSKLEYFEDINDAIKEYNTK